MKEHGHLVWERNDLNGGNLYFCGKCERVHTWFYHGCDGLRTTPSASFPLAGKTKAPMDLEDVAKLVNRVMSQFGKGAPHESVAVALVREAEKHHGIQ